MCPYERHQRARARAAQLFVQQPARSVPGVHRNRLAAGRRRRPGSSPTPSLSLREGAIAAWSKSQFFYPELLETVSKYFGIDMDKPWSKLSKQHQNVLLNGTGDKKIRFGYRNQYGHERWYEAPSRASSPTSSGVYEETQSAFLKGGARALHVGQAVPDV